MRKLLTVLATFSFLGIGVFALHSFPVHAATAITVNSTADDQDNDGECTLREAIIASNTDTASGVAAGECLAGSGNDIIEFNITGAADFTNGGQNGYTIAPASALPTIIETVTVDGFTQPGSSENTAISPDPFDAVLLIEIDGTNTTINTGHCLALNGAHNTLIKGLNINNCANSGVYVEVSNFVSIQGSYIGTDPTGLIDEGVGRDHIGTAIGSGVESISSNNLLIGGDQPAERNVIANSQANEVFWGNEDNRANTSESNTLQGSYLGLGADGLTAMPAGWADGLGNAILMGNSHNDLIGGITPGAKNVIGSSSEYGVGFRDGTSGTVIQGNYIGTDYTGAAATSHANGTGNPYAGVHVGTVSNIGLVREPNDITIGGTTEAARNIISGNDNGSEYYAGISINDGAYDVKVLGNYIGTDPTGTISVPNGNGILLDTRDPNSIEQTYSNSIGGSANGAGNLVKGNINNGIFIAGEGTSDNLIQGNTISENGAAGVVVIEGANDNSIISNSINDNVDYGIDLKEDSVSINDRLDIDSGPNDMLNYPVYTNVSEVSGDTFVEYFIDLPAGDYRVEFFSNTIVDPLGNGEGETYLGFKNITSSGSGLESKSSTLSGITGVTNLAMTATEIDNSADGFGATSEFGGSITQVPISDLSMQKILLDPDTVAPGATINYRLTVINNGYSDIDLTQFDGSGQNAFTTTLIIDFLPPELTYVSSSNPDLTCTNLGAALGVISPNHADWDAISCVYSGSGEVLTANQSISTNFEVVVAEDSDLDFTNIAIAGAPAEDPDASGINDDLTTAFISGGTVDVIDLFEVAGYNNFTTASYPLPVDPTVDLDVTNSTEDLSDLADTGRRVVPLVVLALLVITAGTASVIWRIRQHQK